MVFSEVSNKTFVVQRLRGKRGNEKLKERGKEGKEKRGASVKSIYIHTYIYRMFHNVWSTIINTKHENNVKFVQTYRTV